MKTISPSWFSLFCQPIGGKVYLDGRPYRVVGKGRLAEYVNLKPWTWLDTLIHDRYEYLIGAILIAVGICLNFKHLLNLLIKFI